MHCCNSGHCTGSAQGPLFWCVAVATVELTPTPAWASAGPCSCCMVATVGHCTQRRPDGGGSTAATAGLATVAAVVATVAGAKPVAKRVACVAFLQLLLLVAVIPCTSCPRWPFFNGDHCSILVATVHTNPFRWSWCCMGVGCVDGGRSILRRAPHRRGARGVRRKHCRVGEGKRLQIHRQVQK